MKALVLYYSRMGSTKRLAEAVAEGVSSVKGAECVLREPTTVTPEDFLESDGIVVGSPCYYGCMAADLKSVFDRFVHLRDQMENKLGAAFATSGDASGGGETTLLSILQAMLINGMIVMGDPMSATGHYGVVAKGAPDETALDNARKLGQRIAETALRLGGDR